MSIRRVYETTIIINAALEDPDIDTIINKITALLENHGGVIEEKNKWGRRRLAYAINKKHNGYYVHLIFETLPSVVPVLERFLVLEDTILRHLTLQLPPELRAYRKEKSLAAGRSGETTMSSVVEVEKEPTTGKFIYKEGSEGSDFDNSTIEEEITSDTDIATNVENVETIELKTDEDIHASKFTNI